LVLGFLTLRVAALALPTVASPPDNSPNVAPLSNPRRANPDCVSKGIFSSEVFFIGSTNKELAQERQD